jgi:hypothetical protein
MKKELIEGKNVRLLSSSKNYLLTEDLQIVLRFSGVTNHKIFDFVHATNYFTFEEGLVTNAKFRKHIEVL